MSHFTVAVLTKTGSEEEVAALMAPYDRDEDQNDDPKAFWNWYKIGGRWNNYYFPNNRCKVSEFPPMPAEHEDKHRFDAVITPNGKHYAQGIGAWFGRIVNPKDDWHEIESQLYADNPDCIAVLVDFHN